MLELMLTKSKKAKHFILPALKVHGSSEVLFVG